MPNGLAPLLFLLCYLSRPVVWGESVLGPTPTRGSRLGAGPIQLVSPVECGEPSELGDRGQCSQGGCL